MQSGARNAVRLAADANVLLSCVLGGRARLILLHPLIEQVLTTEATLAEVREYAPVLARKKKIAPELIELAVASLPVVVQNHESYSKAITKARLQPEWRDSDDIDLLALALSENIAIWSNDADFERCTVECYPTARLLSLLGIYQR